MHIIQSGAWKLGEIMVSEIRQNTNQIRKDQTRGALMDAAKAVFLRQGYHGTIVADIVAEANVGQGTFYRHFETKREIFGALFQQLVLQMITEVGSIAEELPTNLAQYHEVSVRVVAATARIMKANRGMIQLFFREGPSVDREFDETLEDLQNQIARLAQGYLEHAMAHGFARKCDSYIVSQMLVGAGVRLMNEFFAGRADETATESTVREAVDFAFFGFGPGVEK